MKNLLLKWQLRRSGATTSQAKDMAKLTKGLNKDLPGLSAEAKKRIAGDIGFATSRPLFTPRYVFASVAALLIVLAVVAQAAKPGDVLYSVKRGTDQIRVIVQPGFTQEDLRKQQEGQKSDDTKQEDNRNSGSSRDDSGDDSSHSDGSRSGSSSDDSSNDNSGSNSDSDSSSSDDSGSGSGSSGDSSGSGSSGSGSGSGSGRDGGGHGSDD